MQGGETFETDVPQRLDRLPWSRWHWRIVVALGVTWVLDGLEVTIVGALGAALTRPETLGLRESEVGLAASAYLAGTVGGAILFEGIGFRRASGLAFGGGLLVGWNLLLLGVYRHCVGGSDGADPAAMFALVKRYVCLRPWEAIAMVSAATYLTRTLAVAFRDEQSHRQS